MTASGWRKLGWAVVVGCLLLLIWMDRHSTNHSWVPDFNGSGISEGDDSSSGGGSVSSASEDEEDSGAADAEAGAGDD